MGSHLLSALAPIFLGLIAGYLAGRRRIVDPANVGSLVTFTMSIALPCSLFMSILHTPPSRLPQLKWIAVVSAVTYMLTYATEFFLGRRGQHSSVNDSAVLALTIAFPNVAAIGLPLLSTIYGPTAAASAAIALAAGAVTVSPMTLALLEIERERSNGVKNVNTISVWLHACTNPVVWAPLIAMVLLFLPWHLPMLLEDTINIFGNATAASTLFITGLVVSAQTLRFDIAALISASIKNFFQPAVALALALLFHLPTASVREVVLICAIPCGFFGLIFGKSFSTTSLTASSSLVISYVSSALSLAITVVLLGTLN